MARKTLYLIWDFDGTLYDTYPQMAQALMLALADFHCKAEYAEAYALIKKTVFHAITTYAERFRINPDDLQARFFEYHHRQDEFPPMAGMADCLHATQRMGCRHYLFTHRNRGAVEQIAADGLDGYFVDYVTHEDGFPDKPAPDAILHLMRTHAFAAGDAYMIGDRDIDIASGHAAGTGGILYDPEGFYPGLAVEYQARTMEDITRWLQARR